MALKRSFAALALAACAVAATAIPARADTLQDVARLVKQGQHSQALEQVDKYLTGKPKDAQARFLKGLILTEMNKPNDAIAVFVKLTEDYPELPEPYNNLAVIYAQQKQYDKAKQALETALRTHPSYAIAHENLGDIYARLASQAYDRALQSDSANSSAQIKLATIKDLMSMPARPGTRANAKPMVVAVAETKPAEVKAVETKPAEPAKPVEPAKPEPPKLAETPKAADAKVAAPPAKPDDGAKPAGNADVAKTLDAWLAAWSRKDVKAYLAHYAKDFQTPGGESRAEWETERAKRINKPGAIHVAYEGLKVSVDGDKATAKFRQHYRSAALKTGSNKVVVLVQRDGRWQIQQEKIGN